MVFLAPRAGAEEAARPAWQARIAEAVKTPDAWKAHAADIRRHILVAAGLWPPLERTPLKPTIFGRIERDGYAVEKVHFETWPGFYLTGNLYRPLGKQGPFPGVVSPHGHWKEGRFEDAPLGSVPGRAITLARFGFVVFSYDMVGFGDLKQVPHDFGDPLWGISLCGLQLWDSLRAVDFLASLPDVDPKRIGCTGASGGGTQTFLLTAVDDRIACAAPVNMVAADFQGGCLCENAPLLRIDLNNVEIAACAAPRPLLLVCATGDWTKDTPTVAAPEIQKVYKLLGVEEKFRVVQFNAEHNYNKDSREAVYAWFVYWLKPPGWEALCRRGLPPPISADDRGPKAAPTPAADPGGRGLQPPTPPEDRGPEAAPTRIPEPPFTVEKREDLAVWGPDHPLPAGAVDAAGLKKEMKNAIKAQLEALRQQEPNQLWLSTGLYETLREVLGEKAIRISPDRNRLEAEYTKLGIRLTLDLKISSPIGGAGGANARACLIVLPPDGQGNREICEALEHSLRNSGRIVACLNLKNLKYVEPPLEAGKESAPRFPTAYRRTALAWRMQAINESKFYLLSHREHVEREEHHRVDVVGLGNVGPETLLAGMYGYPSFFPTIVADLNGLDWADAASWSGDRLLPGMLRQGGLQSAGINIASRKCKLVLHNTQGKFDATWIRDAFKAAGREGDLVVDEKAWTVEQIVEALK